MALIQPFGLKALLAKRAVVDGVADGFEPFVLAQVSAEIAADKPLLFVASDGQRLPAIADVLAFIDPSLPVLELPAWDCLPYDRVSPGADAAARRLEAMGRLIDLAHRPHRAIVLTTANALLQRMPPRDVMAAQSLSFRPGNVVDLNALVSRLERGGFDRVGTVRDVGEFAVRGGILDLFAPGTTEPLRLDFFGDTLESIRAFDPASQRTTANRTEFSMQAMSEVALTPDTISRFRRAYIEAFGAPMREDALYAAVSEGRRFAGMEHWLPFFYEKLETVFEYLPDAPVVFEPLAHQAITERRIQIEDHFDARRRAVEEKSHGDSVPYKPVAPDLMYLSVDAVEHAAADRLMIDLSAFDQPDVADRKLYHAGSRPGRTFAQERADPTQNVFDHAVRHISDARAAGRKVAVAAWSDGSLDRLTQILSDHGLGNMETAGSLATLEKLGKDKVGLSVLPLEHGFETDGLVVIAEQDMLGDRLVRRAKRKRASDFISEATSLSTGDIVVHQDHGIGRFVGLRTIEAAGAPHDCLEIHYAGDGRLFLPVENIELLSRFGSDAAEVALDKLGGGAWQSRKAKLKKKLLEMAGGLIRVAAERKMRGAPRMAPPEGVYGEFAARFPYEETEDQQTAIDAVMGDLALGQPMDRLVCGDVGFGKTEVALRAAFIAAMEGFQVAVVVPTTLLSRQHFKTFRDRFAGLPVKVRQASRLVASKELAETKAGLADGSIDIVVGTHALLGSSIKFRNLGLLIIDEEQHFGVKHKERLKELKSDIHVLTLSATPIPRTLQLALTGVRELSLITTPPVDRMAVRTFISPFDPLVIRETLLRERYRGGRSFYVVPRISDLEEVANFLRASVPELKFATANGQMPPS
ncbi:MAG: DEAD/DEAH box helicase, partial [Mesorhizobium sp.]